MSISTGSSKHGLASQKKSVSAFKLRYSKFCKSLHTQPLKGLKLQVANSSLSIMGDKINYNDWLPLLKAISFDRNLHYIALKSRHPAGTVILQHINTEKEIRELTKGSALFTKGMLIKVVEAFAECIANSRALMCLQFQSIPLQFEAMTILTEAVSKTPCMQHLSLQSCNIGDEGCKLIWQALRNRPSVVTLDLSNCNITKKGAFYIAELIKVQEIARYGECWKHSLRYREVDHEIIPGLRRISLNDNPEIGDEGLNDIVLVLYDDYWVKALDMQNCGITDGGCASIIDLVSMNNVIVVFDVRRNPIDDPNKMTEIIRILCSHTSANDRSEYGWLKIEDNSSGSSEQSMTSSSISYPIEFKISHKPNKYETNSNNNYKYFVEKRRNRNRYLSVCEISKINRNNIEDQKRKFFGENVLGTCLSADVLRRSSSRFCV